MLSHDRPARIRANLGAREIDGDDVLRTPRAAAGQPGPADTIVLPAMAEHILATCPTAEAPGTRASATLVPGGPRALQPRTGRWPAASRPRARPRSSWSTAPASAPAREAGRRRSKISTLAQHNQRSLPLNTTWGRKILMALLAVNGAELYHEVRGSGPPVLLIMGFTGDGGHFESWPSCSPTSSPSSPTTGAETGAAPPGRVGEDLPAGAGRRRLRPVGGASAPPGLRQQRRALRPVPDDPPSRAGPLRGLARAGPGAAV